METLVATAGEYEPDIRELGDQIVNLSIMQAMQLGRYIREVHGIEPASYGVQIETAPIKKEEEAPVLLNVMLVKVADQTKKISVIKTIREITGLGLAESKMIVDKAPMLVKPGVPREDAEKIKALIEEAGGTVDFK